MNTTVDYAGFLADGLTRKFADQGAHFPKVFEVERGRKYDRITQRNETGPYSKSVHAFVEKETGFVYKAAGYKAPAKGVRYHTVEAALAAADVFGSYLYAK